ncbi:MAG: S1C family serine protease [Planctomycetota bacterium]|jgi:S1-C subfamily serine protease
MREVLVVLALAAATAYAQDLARARRAVVHVEAVDRAFLRAQQLQRERASIQVLSRLRIHQPYTLIVSGIAISPKGEILTPALHPRADLQLTVTFHDGAQRKAEIVGTDPLSNLALIQVAGETKEYLRLSEAPPERDAAVEVVGYEAHRGRPVAVPGRVGLEAMPVKIQDLYGITAEGTIHLASVFLVATRARGPNVGSACVDGQGRLCGVLVGDMPQQRVQVHAALPAARVERIVRDLRRHGRVIRADFGLKVAPLTSAVRAQFELQACACSVRRLQPRGPAAKAGLRTHDIVLSVDGETYRDPYALGEALWDKEPGRPATFQLLRAGRKLEVAVTPVELK